VFGRVFSYRHGLSWGLSWGLFLAGQLQTTAQFVDLFADSNFTQNPTWWGDTGVFVVNAQRALQLNAPAVSGTACLMTRSRAMHQGLWEIKLNMDFNPSSVNLLEVYLTATDSQPAIRGQGYLLRLGGSLDNIEFYKYQQGTRTRIGSLAPGLLQRELNPISIKVQRFQGGLWYFWADSSATPAPLPSWQWLGTLTDHSITRSEYFGIAPIYTSTRSKLFSFRSFEVQGGPVPDTLPPRLLEWFFDNPRRMVWKFSEPMDTGTGTTGLQVLQPAELPAAAPSWISDTVLAVNYVTDYPGEHLYSLRITGLKDLSGLVVDTLVAAYRNIYRPGRLLLSEIMCDPDPPLQPQPRGLPASEFVEIYNPGSIPLRLKGCSLQDPGSKAWLPHAVLPPKQGALLVPEAWQASWENWSQSHSPSPGVPVWGLANWPTLNNESDFLRLAGPEEQSMDSLAYDLSWWPALPQKQGGWSLTRKKLACPCMDSINWQPSTHLLGGSPGWWSEADTGFCQPLSYPLLKQVLVETNGRLRLQFGTPVRPQALTRISWIKGQDTVPLQWPYTDTTLLQKEWTLDPEFIPWPGGGPEPGEAYSLASSGWLTCDGVSSGVTLHSMGVGQPVQNGEVLISEVYPRPLATDWPWVECCNISGKVLDRSRIWLMRTGPEGENLEGVPLGQAHEVWFPKQCLLCSRNPDFLQLEQLQPCNPSPDRSTPVLSLPALPKTGAFLALQDATGQVLDRVSYQDSSFHPFLLTADGLSLRRSPESRAWTGSAHPQTLWISSTPGDRAQPGCYPDSSSSLASMPGGIYGVKRKSPCGLILSGAGIDPLQHQVLSVSLRSNSNLKVNLYVTDLMGRVVGVLANEEWAEPGRVWFWDGRSGQQAPWPQGWILPTGAYLIRLHWSDPQGLSGWDLAETFVHGP